MDKVETEAKVVAVFHARVKAHSGNGTVTALVVSGSRGRLYGTTNLCKIGLLPQSYHGRYLRANALANLLHTEVVSGQAACVAYLAENGIEGIAEDAIIGDSASPAGVAVAGDNLAAW